jgi:uncharacterized membrane protein
MESTSAEATAPGRGRHQKRVNVGPAERKASVVGGSILALSGLGTLSRKHILPGLALVAAGGALFYRGKTGHCDLYQTLGIDTIHTSGSGLRMEKVVTVNRPPHEVYEFWHNLENLPRFMQHLESVQVTGERTSHWVARGPGGISAQWDAEMMDDYPGQQISWHSVGAADLPNRGAVEFKEAPGGRGTEVRVTVEYYPPGGAAGRAAARMAQVITAQQLEEDLKRLKQVLETGEIATARNTAAAKRSPGPVPLARNGEGI